MFTSILRTLVTLGLATAATAVTVAGSAAPASAQTAPSVRIDARGIDLNNPAGRTLVEAQVRRAANRVCNTAERHELKTAMAARACTDKALVGGLARIDQLASQARIASTAPVAAPRTAG